MRTRAFAGACSSFDIPLQKTRLLVDALFQGRRNAVSRYENTVLQGRTIVFDTVPSLKDLTIYQEQGGDAEYSGDASDNREVRYLGH